MALPLRPLDTRPGFDKSRHIDKANIMQKPAFLQRLAAAGLALTLTLSLSACGGSGTPDDGNLPEAQDYYLVNNYNYAYVYAVGAGAYARLGEVNAIRGLALQTMLTKGGVGGDYPCRKSGSIRMAAADKTYSFSLSNCDTGEIFLASGNVILSLTGKAAEAGQPPVEYDTEIKTVSYRADSSAQVMQTLEASVGERFLGAINDGKSLDVAYGFTVTREGKKNRYSAGVTNPPGANSTLPTWVTVHTDGAIQLRQSLDVRPDLAGSRLTVTGRGDKSSVTGIRLPPNGQSIQLEVRAFGSEQPSLVKIISANDLQELVWRAL
jgi:hypothetical protein